MSPTRSKTIYYTATSLDGFLATPDDDLGWLDQRPPPTEDTYTPFIANVGAICMGAATYRFLLRHVDAGNPWPHPQPTWVFTHRDLPVPKGASIRFVQGDVRPVHAAMQDAAPGQDLWVAGGGALAAQFLAAHLLDELVITVASARSGQASRSCRRAPICACSVRAHWVKGSPNFASRRPPLEHGCGLGLTRGL
jgi:dihydrofolate reductase